MKKDQQQQKQQQQKGQHYHNIQIRKFYKRANNAKGFKTNAIMIRNGEGETIIGK